MSEKVFDVHGDVKVNTRDAERSFDRMASRANRFGDSMAQADRISVSFTRRMRSGFDTGMIASLRRNEGGLLALGNAFQVAGAGMKKIENESVMALRSFQRLQRGGFALQSLFGVLAGSIGDLSGGVLSLVGILGQAAYAFVGVGGALMSVVAGFAIAKVAMSGIGKAVSQLWNGQAQYNNTLKQTRRELKDMKFDLESAVLSEKEAAIELEKAREQLARVQNLPPDNRTRREAELEYQRADLNYRRAKSRVEDLQDTIKTGGTAAARAAGTNPFQNLTKSQIAFAKYLATLKPLMQGLKEAAASSFLPPLQQGIQNLIKTLLPSLMVGFNQLGSAMGYALKQISNTFNNPDNLKAFQDFFTDSKPRLEQLGDAAGKFLGGFLKLMHAAKPVTDRFVTWIDSVSSRFNAMADSQSTKKFLETAGYVASQLGHVFGNFGDGIKNIMDANFPPGGGGAGQVLLDWLNGIALGFKKFTGSDTFATWLKNTTENSTTMLSVIGDFLHIFLDLAGQPEIKQFWTTLQGAIPSITKMLMDGIKAGPSFAALIVSVTKLVSIFSDSGALTTFFDTLKSITDIFIRILEPLKPFLDFLGKIHGWVLAVTLVMSGLTAIGMLFMAFLGQLLKNLGKIANAFMGVTDWATRFNTNLAINGRGIKAWGRSLVQSLGEVFAGSKKLQTVSGHMKDYFKKLKTAVIDYKISVDFLRDTQRRMGDTFKLVFSKINQGYQAVKTRVLDVASAVQAQMSRVALKVRDGFNAVKATVYDAGMYVKNLLLPPLKKFRDIALTGVNNARSTIYATLLLQGRLLADFYNGKVIPVFRRFQAAINPQAIKMKMMAFAAGMLMHIDLIDKRIIPAFMRMGQGITGAMNKVKLALSPQNIKMKMMGLTMGMLMHIDLIDKRIIPGFIRMGQGIAGAMNRLKVALSPQSIKMSLMGFTAGMLMHIDLIDNRIIPGFIRMGQGIKLAFENIRVSAIKLSMKMERTLSGALFRLKNNFNFLAFAVRMNLRDLRAIAVVVGGELVAKFNRLKNAIMQSTFMIKAQAVATKIATVASKIWSATFGKLPNAFRSIGAGIKGFIEKIRQKTSAEKASTAATQASTKAIEQNVNALKKQKNAAGAAATGGRRPGAGSALMGAGFAAEGLISGAANGGMSAGSALTTIGGAAMFIPGAGMAVGLGLSIVGSIVQGFEAAAKAAREKRQAINAQKVEITAQSVATTTAQVGDELAQLMATGKYTLSAATALVEERRNAGQQIATTTGADATKLDAIRLAFQNAGVAANSETMTRLLTSAGNYSAYNKDQTADQISSAILSVFKSKGVGAVESNFAAVTTPSGQALQVQVQNTGGVNQVREVTAGETTQAQTAKILKLLYNPKNYSIKGEGQLASKNFFNQDLLKGFSSEAIRAAMNTDKGKALNDYTQTILDHAAKGITTRFQIGTSRLGKPIYQTIGADKVTSSNIGGLYGSSGVLSGSSLDKIKGTTSSPSVVNLLPSSASVVSLKSTADASDRTAKFLSQLAGAKDPNGNYLNIRDISPKDKVAPQIVIPKTGITDAQRQEYVLLNAALVAAWSGQ